MATTFVVGLDGSPAGERALAFARERARNLESCTIVLVYVVEWSPYTFQTAEENEERHKRREEEVATARERVIEPTISALGDTDFTVEQHVAHGDAASILDRVARDRGAAQIIVGRVGQSGLIERIFGGVSGRLVATASVPVTIVP